MTTYTFSALADGSLQAFIAGTDQLILDTLDTQPNSVAITLGSLEIVESAAGVTFWFGDKSVTLTGVTIQQLVGSTIAAGTGNIQYDGTINPGILQFGDNTTTSPDLGQSPAATNADDFFVGGDGADTFNGQQGNDHILSGAGNDFVRGGMGNDFIDGGAGDDQLFGDRGDDVVFGGDGNDYISEAFDTGVVATGSGETTPAGMNTIYGGMGDDTIIGGEGDDTIYGGMDNDTLFGGLGNDTLRGDLGDDVLFGGLGGDTLTGGGGADDFVFLNDETSGADLDVVTDFEDGTDSIVLVDSTGAQLTGAALIAAVNSALASIQVIDGNTFITLDGGQRIKLNGITDLDATDFAGVTTGNVSVGDVTVAESDGMATVTFTLDQPSDVDTIIYYSTSNGTATSGSDFTGVISSVTIAAGMTSATADITIAQDTGVEGSQTFTVNVTNVTNGGINDGSGTVTITDDDSNPAISDLVASLAATGGVDTLDGSVTVSSGNTNGGAANWNGGSLLVSSTDGAVISLGGGVTLVGNLVIVGGSLVGTVTNAFGDTLAAISFNQFATSADIETIIENLQVQDATATPTSQNLNITLTNGNGNSSTSTVTVTTDANTALAITNLDGDSTLVQSGDMAVNVDVGGNADNNIDASQGAGAAAGATLAVAITAGLDADDDHLSLSSGGVTVYNNTFVVVGSTIVGTVTGLNATSMTISFNASASQAAISAVLQAVTFDTDPGGDDGDRTITATLTSGVSGDATSVSAIVSVAGNVFILTDDDIGLNTPDTFTGTSGVDIFSGAGGVSAAAGTLDDDDVLNGGAGSMSDRLIADLLNETVDPTISNINYFQLTNNSGGAGTLDFSNITGATGVTVAGANDVTLDHLASSVTSIDASAFSGMLVVNIDNASGSGDVTIAGGTGNDTFNFGDTLNGGSGDEIDGNAGMDTLNGEITANYVAHIDDVETVNLTAEGDFSIDASDISSAGDTAVNLSNGAGMDIDLTVTGLGFAVNVVNASGLDDATDSVNLSFDVTSGTVTATGSAGGDSFDFGASLDNADVIDGAGGSDSLTATLAASVTTLTPNVANVETIDLAIENAINDVTLVTTGISGTGMTLNLSNGAATNVDVIIGAVGSVLTTINASGLDNAADSVALTFDQVSAVTVTGSEGADTFTFDGTFTSADDVDGGMGADSLWATLSGATTITAGNLDNVETLNLSANGGAAYTVDIAAATGVSTLNAVVDDNGTDATFTLADSVTAVDIDNAAGAGEDQDVTINGISATSSVSSIDASGLNDGVDSLTVDASLLTTAITITGSTGDDTITGGSGGDMLNGGAGADNITAGAGADQVDGGAGNDTIVFGANLTAADDVNGGADADTLSATFSGSFTAASGQLDAVETLNFTETTAGTINVAAASGVTAINLDVGDSVAENDDFAVTLTVADSVAAVDIDESAVTNDNLDVTVNGIGALSALAGVDASGLTDAASSLTINASASATGITVTGSAGDDSVTGGMGADTLTGGAGADTISGNAGMDIIVGGAGIDVIDGGADDDTITGGDGMDTITTGSGADAIVYTYTPDGTPTVGEAIAALQAQTGLPGVDRDLITDFSLGDDVIDVDAFAGLIGFNGTSGWTFVGTATFSGGNDGNGEIRYAQNGPNTLIEFDLNDDGVADAHIDITGVYTLSGTDFDMV